MRTFKEKYDVLAEKKGVTYREVAEAIGATEVSFCRWIRGERVPKRIYLENLATYFGVSVEYFLQD